LRTIINTDVLLLSEDSFEIGRMQLEE